jgi:hypothetical protein
MQQANAEAEYAREAVRITPEPDSTDAEVITGEIVHDQKSPEPAASTQQPEQPRQSNKQPAQKPACQPEQKAANRDFPMTHGELVKALESAELIDEVTGRAVDLNLLIDITERKFASAGKHFNAEKIKGLGSEIGPKTCHILELMLKELKAAKKAQEGSSQAA